MMAAPTPKLEEEDVARRARQRRDNVVPLRRPKPIAKADDASGAGTEHDDLKNMIVTVSSAFRGAWSTYAGAGVTFEIRRQHEERLLALERDLRRLKDTVGWHRYLMRLEQRSTPRQATVIRQAWCRIEDALRAEPPLPMAASDDGTISIAWSRFAWYLGFEVLPDGRVEWFFRDRQSGTAEGTRNEPEPELPDRFFELMVTYASR